MMKKKLVDLLEKLNVPRQGSEVTVKVLKVLLETKAAYCIVVEDDEFGREADRIWLPKSQVNRDGLEFTMLQWLCEEKELEEHVL